MTMPTADAGTLRITARIPAGMRDRLEEAAEFSGATPDEFVVQSAIDEAVRVFERETTIRLSRECAEQVVALLDHPRRPTSGCGKH